MAKVASPLKSEKASGKYGTEVFLTSRGQNIVRIKVDPKQPRTTRQLTVRAQLTAIMQGYGLLTSSQVAGWSALAKTKKKTDQVGNSYSIGSANEYMACNALVTDCGGGIETDAPAVSPAATVESIVLGVPGTGKTGFTLTPTLLGTGTADDFLDIWIAGPFKSPNRVATEAEYKHFVYKSGDAITASIEGLVLNGYYWLKARYVDQYGQVTGFAKANGKAVHTTIVHKAKVAKEE